MKIFLHTDISMSETENYSNISWCDIVDKEAEIIDRPLKIQNLHESCNYNISEILNKDPRNIDDLTLLEYESFIINMLKKYTKQNTGLTNGHQYGHQIEHQNEHHDQYHSEQNMKEHIDKFEWLANASLHMSNKLGLKIHKSDKLEKVDKTKLLDKSKVPRIPRSSYKFCEWNYECEFNYKNKIDNRNNDKNGEKHGCYAHHFVHNIIYTDIMHVINYINNNEILDNKEIDKSITTFSFVIKHMYDELSNIKKKQSSDHIIKHMKYKHKNKKESLIQL